MRLSSKTIIVRDLSQFKDFDVDFEQSDFYGALAGKGIKVIHEITSLCPCKSRESDHQTVCKNCGGVGYIWLNPTQTRMIVQSVSSDNKYKEAAMREWGMTDLGSVKITAYPFDKLGYMDKITLPDAFSEHQQLIYPMRSSQLIEKEDFLGSFLTEDFQGSIKTESQAGFYFAFTKYNIKSIDYIALFVDDNTKLQRLLEGTDYTFNDNIIKFNSNLITVDGTCVTIRYVFNPVYHVMDITRDSMTSYLNQGKKRIPLPIMALAKRAHLIKDLENFNGDRLFDNSWLPAPCEPVEVTEFIRILHYMSTQDIYNNLTAAQKTELALLIGSDDTIMGTNGGLLEIQP